MAINECSTKPRCTPVPSVRGNTPRLFGSTLMGPPISWVDVIRIRRIRARRTESVILRRSRRIRPPKERFLSFAAQILPSAALRSEPALSEVEGMTSGAPARQLAHAPCCGAIWRRIMAWSGSNPGMVRRTVFAPARAGATLLRSQESRFAWRIGRTTVRHDPNRAYLRRTAAGARQCAQRMRLHGFAGETRASERNAAFSGLQGNCVLARAGRTIRKGKIYNCSEVMTRPRSAERQQYQV